MTEAFTWRRSKPQKQNPNRMEAYTWPLDLTNHKRWLIFVHAPPRILDVFNIISWRLPKCDNIYILYFFVALFYRLHIGSLNQDSNKQNVNFSKNNYLLLNVDVFNDISTFVGYLLPNPVYTYIRYVKFVHK